MNRSIIIVCIIVPLLALAVLMNAIQAQANIPTPQNVTFNVNSNVDATDINPGNGICETATDNGICSLRAAIQESDNLSGTDTIILPPGIYTLTLSGVNDDLGITGDLDISDDLVLQGHGITTTIINGGSIDRIFHIIGSSHVEINNVTIINGYVDDSFGGGGILNEAFLTLTHTAVNSNTAMLGMFGTSGGGIQNWGALNLINSEIKYNYSEEVGGGIHLNGGASLYMLDSIISDNHTNSQGGGISSYAYYDSITATIINSTISKNSTSYSGSSGGGISVGIASYFVIDNSTISSNRASYLGGGISNNGGHITITNSTIYSNTASEGGFYNSGSFAILNNTIIANNLNHDCSGFQGSILSTGFNLASDNSCPFTNTGDIQNIDPLLGLLKNNGGPTPTHVPFPNSPVLDLIPVGVNGCGTTVTTDQRSTNRPQDSDEDGLNQCDIGAVELEAGHWLSLFLPLVETP